MNNPNYFDEITNNLKENICSFSIYIAMFIRARPVETFSAKPCHATCTGSNHPYPLCMLLVRRKFNFDRFFHEALLWDRLSRACFLDHYSSNLVSNFICPTHNH